MDVISAENEMALKSSVKQLRGMVSDKVRQLREAILYEIAFIESALDDPEHISLEGYSEKLGIKVRDLLNDVDKLIASADNGKIMKEGINTVILGKPNAGKSSLLNLLAGQEKAIVTDIAGTTRDILEEHINLHGISLNLIDTAGIRNTDDVVEKIGVEKAKKTAEDADLIIYVVDSSTPLDENDFEILKMIHDRKCIILFNKTDLEAVITEEELKERVSSDAVILKTSTACYTGIDAFEQKIKDMFFHGDINLNDEVMITNMRHKEELMHTRESLIQVQKSLNMGMPEDFYSIDLMSAYTSLGTIIGEEVGDDLVNEIFSKFCMGK
jgi:tRNA modification GTPase